MFKICICGGGNLGHVIAGYLASKDDCRVSVLTRNSDKWSNVLKISDLNNKTYTGELYKISNDASEVLSDIDIVLLCLPGHYMKKELQDIAPFLNEDMYVGSIVSNSGFFLWAQEILPKHTKLFGFQRTPMEARISEYGHSARIDGYKSSLAIATLNVPDETLVKRSIELLFGVPVKILDNYMAVTLSNSNPLLHPSRLYTLFGHQHNREATYPRQPSFYEEWDDMSSELLISCDNELQTLVRVLGLPADSVPPILKHYDSHDAQSLTQKLRSIPGFKGVKVPMKQIDTNGFVLDYEHRYFREDIPYGLSIIKYVAQKHNVKTPTIDKILNWAESLGIKSAIGAPMNL